MPENMPSEEMFDLYSAPDAPASKQHRGECSKEPPAKKTRTENPSAAGPSKNTTPHPSPLEQQTPPASVESTPSPPAPVDQTQPATPVQTGDDILSCALRSAKDRMTRILRHERSREVMAGTESMDVN
ncbi:proline-rich receptor-like protein kinase PERK1 [Humulus lupulus]|uniref:proline-rich receptor-like protein kinase PERK1 n=1 Tax=Humulus lupulus TaxID=3486 RepID=UPI002B416014|nr:proline-rich receptor-like protein kinase PERK1 [Humulus lupulus]